jgi:hypothetical protein
VVSRRSNRRRQLSPRREAVKKQEARWPVAEHAYRDKEREEWVEEARIPVMHTTFLAGRGRGS